MSSKKHKIQTPEDITNSKHFCILPWIHMYILPDNTGLPCCVTDHADSYADLKKNTLKDGINSEKMRAMRKLMLEDRPVYSCDYCMTLEKSGGFSMRKEMNQWFSHHATELKSTQSNGAIPDHKMRYLDVRFSNRCNFKCRGCSPTLSTQWYEDYEKLWGVKSEQPKLVNSISDNPKLWQDLVGQIEHLERAYFAGGEPLLMEEHYQFLELLIARERKDIILSYNSNLSVLKFKQYDLLALWRQFKVVHLMVSLDDIQQRGEYFRSGLVWTKFIKNLSLIKKELPHVRVTINCTVSLFNISRIPEIHSFLYGNGYIDSNGFLFNSLVTPEVYRTQTLPQKLKLLFRAKLISYLVDLKQKYPTVDWMQFDNDLKHEIKYMLEQDLSHLQQEFRDRTLKLDRIRGEDFVTTFPELKNLF